MKLKIFILFMFFFMSSNVVLAKQANTFGVGGVSCGTLISELNDYPRTRVNEAWINGFLSGINATEYQGRSDVGANIDVDGRWQTVLQFCRQQPMKSIQEAAIDLYIKMFNQ